MNRFADRETRPVTLEEANKLAVSAKGSPELDTIGDDLCRRIINVDNHLVILHERLDDIANRLMGPLDQVNEKGPGETTTLCPPLVERLSGGIHTLERRANQLEQTLNRFIGLV